MNPRSPTRLYAFAVGGVSLSEPAPQNGVHHIITNDGYHLLYHAARLLRKYGSETACFSEKEQFGYRGETNALCYKKTNKLLAMSVESTLQAGNKM